MYRRRLGLEADDVLLLLPAGLRPVKVTLTLTAHHSPFTLTLTLTLTLVAARERLHEQLS